jgi:D-sedoheptulose 7-phosphate isomerase
LTYNSHFLDQTIKTINKIDSKKIDKIVQILIKVRKQGRLFIIGVGGSAGNASHAVNDFRKLCDIDTLSPIDNVSEITARTNDEGWETVFSEWLKVSKANNKDALMVFSVGGGNILKKVSVNIISAIKIAKKRNLKIISVLGSDKGYAYKNSDISIVNNPEDGKLVTPISEALQPLIWHLLVSHPMLQTKKTKW